MKNLLLAEWKRRLGLYDWRIVLDDKCEPADMAIDDCAGCTEWTEANKTAKVQIMDEQYYGTRILPFDYERILVHELLHLKLSFLSDTENPLQNRIVHQLIDDLARAFIDAKQARNSEGD